MRPLLFDEGLSPLLAAALSAVGWPAYSVGHRPAPPSGSSDHENCAWCAENDAVLVTNDRGKKDRAIFDAIAEHHVHALFVHNDFRLAPMHHQLRAILIAEGKVDVIAAGRLLRHRLRIGGGLDKR